MSDLSDGKIDYLTSPSAGEITELKSVPDQYFSKKNLGDGFAVNLSDSIIKAPCDGEIIQVFKAGHAFGLKAESGLELLIHIGIDTVKLDGKGFKKMINSGDKVKKGQHLVEVDLNLLKKEGFSAATPVVITNMEDISSLNLIKLGRVEFGEKVLEFTHI